MANSLQELRPPKAFHVGYGFVNRFNGWYYLATDSVYVYMIAENSSPCVSTPKKLQVMTINFLRFETYPISHMNNKSMSKDT